MQWFEFFIIFVLFVGTYAGIENYDTSRLAEAKILAKIETLRQKFITDGYDPYHFDESQFHLDDLGLTLDIKATGLINGMLNFNISKFTFNIKVGGGYKFAFTMELPVIGANFETYTLDGWYGIFPLFGNGTVQSKISGIVYEGSGELETINGDDGLLLYLAKYSCSLKVNNANFQILGWLNNDAQSKLLTNLFNENVNYVFETKQAEINAKIVEKVTAYAKDKTIPLEDLIS